MKMYRGCGGGCTPNMDHAKDGNGRSAWRPDELTKRTHQIRGRTGLRTCLMLLKGKPLLMRGINTRFLVHSDHSPITRLT